jgi:hypothetical protein
MNVSGHILIRACFWFSCVELEPKVCPRFTATLHAWTTHVHYPHRPWWCRQGKYLVLRFLTKFEVVDSERIVWCSDSSWKPQTFNNILVYHPKLNKNLAIHISEARIRTLEESRSCITGHRLPIPQMFKFPQGVFLVICSRQLTGPDGSLLFLILRTPYFPLPMASIGVCRQ